MRITILVVSLLSTVLVSAQTDTREMMKKFIPATEAILFERAPNDTVLVPLTTIDAQQKYQNKLGGVAGQKIWITLKGAKSETSISNKADSFCFIVSIKPPEAFNNTLLQDMYAQSGNSFDNSTRYLLYKFESNANERVCVTLNQTNTIILNKQVGKDYSKGEPIKVVTINEKQIKLIARNLSPGEYAIIDQTSQRDVSTRASTYTGYTFRIE